MIGSVQRCLPDKKIVVYDLGLNWSQRRELNSYCNVELRLFPFDNYEPFMKDLGYFSWKVVIAKILSQEYKVIMYGDFSLRMISCDINKALAHLFKFPFLDARPIRYHTHSRWNDPVPGLSTIKKVYGKGQNSSSRLLADVGK